MRHTTAAAVLTALTLASCAKGGGLSNLGLDRFLPKVSFVRLAVDDIDFQHVDTDFVLKIDNPNPVGVKLSSFSWKLDLAEERWVSGDNPEGLAIAASGSSKVRIPVSVVFTELVDRVGELRQRSDVPFALSGSMAFDTPLGDVKVPYRASGEFPMLHVPKVAFQAVRLGEVDLLRQRAGIVIDLGISHENAKKMAFQKFDYAMTMDGRRVLEGVVGDLGEVEPGVVKTVSLPIDLNVVDVGLAIFQSVVNKEKIQFGLDAVADVGTPFGVIPLAIDETGKLQIR